jgi:small-conductance mechanosensitive channel
VAERTQAAWEDALAEILAATRGISLIVFAVFLGSLALSVPEQSRSLLQSLALITLTVQAGLWLHSLLMFWLGRGIRTRRESDPGSVAALNVMSWVGRLLLWSMVLLLVLDNLGISVTALVAGLGVGGIAVALAVQNILGDLLASLSIVLDKPLVVGDLLVIDDYLGSVEHVGLKTTRLRSLSGEQLVISNTDLLSSRIRNYGRMYERRVLFTLGVTYATPREKLRQIPQMIREAVENREQTRFDRSHFKGYGACSLDFETVYYVLGPDFNLHMDIQQVVNFAIHAHFESAGIEFAYPTQTVLLEQPGKSGSRA